MKTSDVIEFFGTQQAVADALDIYQSSVAEWGDEPPPLRQVQLEGLTNGKLKANPACYGTAAKFLAPKRGRRKVVNG